MKFPSVLIVDDNEDDRYLLRRLLRRGKIADQVFEVENGQEALEFFKNRAEQEKRYPGRFPPMVVFLDINMPLVNGFGFLEAFQGFRASQGYELTVFMMFSSSEREEDRSRALAYEFVRGFITKMPASAEVLRAKIATALQEG